MRQTKRLLALHRGELEKAQVGGCMCVGGWLDSWLAGWIAFLWGRCVGPAGRAHQPPSAVLPAGTPPRHRYAQPRGITRHQPHCINRIRIQTHFIHRSQPLCTINPTAFNPTACQPHIASQAAYDEAKAAFDAEKKRARTPAKERTSDVHSEWRPAARRGVAELLRS